MIKYITIKYPPKCMKNSALIDLGQFFVNSVTFNDIGYHRHDSDAFQEDT